MSTAIVFILAAKTFAGLIPVAGPFSTEAQCRNMQEQTYATACYAVDKNGQMKKA